MFVDIAERAERYGEALEWEEKTRQRLDRLEREHRLGRPAIEEAQALAGILRPLYRAAARGMRWDAASPEPPAPPELPPALHDNWRLLYAAGLARRGRHAEAAAIAREIGPRHPDRVVLQRYIARIFALCAAAVAPGQPDAALSPDQRRIQQSYIDSARDAARRRSGCRPPRSSMS